MKIKNNYKLAGFIVVLLVAAFLFNGSTLSIVNGLTGYGSGSWYQGATWELAPTFTNQIGDCWSGKPCVYTTVRGNCDDGGNCYQENKFADTCAQVNDIGLGGNVAFQTQASPHVKIVSIVDQNGQILSSDYVVLRIESFPAAGADNYRIYEDYSAALKSYCVQHAADAFDVTFALYVGSPSELNPIVVPPVVTPPSNDATVTTVISPDYIPYIIVVVGVVVFGGIIFMLRRKK